MVSYLQRLMRSKSGGSATEYGLVASLIAIALIGAIGLTGTSMSGMFAYIGSTISGALGSF